MKYETLTKLRDELNQLLESTDPNQQKIDKPNKPSLLVCSDCKKSIPENVAEYSQKFYGKHLCRECQLTHQKEGEELL